MNALREVTAMTTAKNISASNEANGAENNTSAFDRNTLMERMDSNMDLIREMVALLRRDAPRMLAEIRDGIAGGNMDTVRRSAHALKGAVANFAAGDAYDCACHLEAMEDEVENDAITDACDALERAMTRLLKELNGIAG